MNSLTIKQMPRQFVDERYGMVIYTGCLKDRLQIKAHVSVAGAVQQALTGIKEWITLCVYLDDNRHFINQLYFGMKIVEH